MCSRHLFLTGTYNVEIVFHAAIKYLSRIIPNWAIQIE